MSGAPGRGGRPFLLTAEVSRAICEAVSRGSFDWVAAEAAGVSRRTMAYWLELGVDVEAGTFRGVHGSEYLQFLRDVRTARAQARVLAEHEVFSRNPLAWLRYGPGREREGAPGWTQSRRDEVAPSQSAGDQVLMEALAELAEGEARGAGSAAGALGPGPGGAPSRGGARVLEVEVIHDD
jgi:hypothetical protein